MVMRMARISAVAAGVLLGAASAGIVILLVGVMAVGSGPAEHGDAMVHATTAVVGIADDEAVRIEPGAMIAIARFQPLDRPVAGDEVQLLLDLRWMNARCGQ